MGNLQATAYAELVEDGTTSLELALSAHLQSNMYPPLPLGYVPLAVQALAAASEALWDADEGWLDPEALEAEIEVPAALDPRPRTLTHRDGLDWITAARLIEILHIEAFIADTDERN